MDNWKLKTPVALILFKRPATTEKVFEAIRQAKPPKLLVIADGPRPDRPGEAEKCAATRAIIDRVDWECEVVKNYSDINLGCGLRPATGISWVFEQVEEAIILEDDCLPDLTFFRFCHELLEKYRNDQRIMHISGNNFQQNKNQSLLPYSYYFSRYPHCWGWASWRRAWKYFDWEIKILPKVLESGYINNISQNPSSTQAWVKKFKEVYDSGKNHIWDYQWTFACWIQSGLSINPNINLVSNIGFDADATHTIDSGNWRNNMPIEAMKFPLQHPPFVMRDKQKDNFTEKVLFSNKSSLIKRIKSKLAKMRN